MRIQHNITPRIEKAYAKIGWHDHYKGMRLYLYLIKSSDGGAGSIYNGTSVEWVSPELDTGNIERDYTWVRSDRWTEEHYENNEQALDLLETE